MFPVNLFLVLCSYALYQWDLFWQERHAALMLAKHYQATVQTDCWTRDGPGEIPQFRPEYFPKYGVIYSPVTAVFLEGCTIDEHAWTLVHKLRFLKFLHIEDCQIVVPTGLDFSDLTHLEFLEVKNVRLSVSEIRTLEKLPRIKALWLYDAGARDDWLLPLSRLRDLEWLWISGDITDEGVHRIAALNGLRALGLPKTQISPKACETIAAIPHLEILDLAETAISDEGIKYLRRVRSLRVLNVRGTAITDKGVQYLASLPSLEALYLDNTCVTMASLAILESMPSLNPDRVTMEGTAIDREELTRWYQTNRRRGLHNQKAH